MRAIQTTTRIQLLMLLTGLFIAGCSGSGGLAGGPCTPATFTAHEEGGTLPCKQGVAGYFKSSMGVGTANLYPEIPTISCGEVGTVYVVEASGPDVHLPESVGHAKLEICGYQGPGRYSGVGATSVVLSIQYPRNEPVQRSAEDTSCEVCINPDGQTGGYNCQNLRPEGNDPDSSGYVRAQGSFSCQDS